MRGRYSEHPYELGHETVGVARAVHGTGSRTTAARTPLSAARRSSRSFLPRAATRPSEGIESSRGLVTAGVAALEAQLAAESALAIWRVAVAEWVREAGASRPLPDVATATAEAARTISRA